MSHDNSTRRALFDDSPVSRRGFLKTSAALSAAALAAGVSPRARATAPLPDEVKVGVIGCGGRGTGAAVNAVTAAAGVRITALGDLFQDRWERCRSQLIERLEGAADLPLDRCFTGFDAYRGVLATDCDVVILATPPGFRPDHIRAAVEAGKHIFAEKPVAVDSAGVRSVLQSADLIDQKGLSFVAGTQFRHELIYQETVKRIHDGAIGDVLAADCHYLTGALWMHPRQPEWSDMEWQLRNWLYFTWLSGDHIVEQHVHNIDVVSWVLGTNPVSAIGMGGRQVRTDPAYGHIYDHFAVEFQHPEARRVMSLCRQMDGCARKVGELIIGTKGRANPRGLIEGENPWRFSGTNRPGLVEEHAVLIKAVRGGQPVNECRQIGESSLAAILGRMSAYTGREITWEEALESPEDLMPERLEFGGLAVPPVAMPGRI